MKVLNAEIYWLEDTTNTPYYRLLVDQIDPAMLIDYDPNYIYPEYALIEITDKPDHLPENCSTFFVDPVWLSDALKPFHCNVVFTRTGWVPYDPKILKSWIVVSDRYEALAYAMRELEQIVWHMAEADPDEFVRERMTAFSKDIAKYWTDQIANAPGAARAIKPFALCQICNRRIARQVFSQTPILTDGPIHPFNRIVGHPSCCKAYREKADWTLPVRERAEWLANLNFSYELKPAPRLAKYPRPIPEQQGGVVS